MLLQFCGMLCIIVRHCSGIPCIIWPAGMLPPTGGPSAAGGAEGWPGAVWPCAGGGCEGCAWAGAPPG